MSRSLNEGGHVTLIGIFLKSQNLLASIQPRPQGFSHFLEGKALGTRLASIKFKKKMVQPIDNMTLDDAREARLS